MHPLLIIIIFISLSHSIARDTITPNNPLADNETLISGDGTFSLGFFSPGKSKNRYIGLWYNKATNRTVVWVANRNNPVTNSTGVLSISSNGNLLITDQNSTVFWSSGVTNVTNPVAQLLNTGNLVVRDAESEEAVGYAWQGFDHPTDTLIAGMKIGVDLVTGSNWTLNGWTSDSDPTPSQYYVMMDIRGSPELAFCVGSNKLWRTGPWNGLGFSGIPETLTYSGFNFSFINNKQEITYSFNTNQSVLSRLTVNQSGKVERSLWVDGSGLWNIIWYAPNDQCDNLPLCGPFATCNPNDSPKCDCIQGFTPKSPDKWVYRDAVDGCVRKTPLDCKNRTDGFLTMHKTKLADTANATVDTSLSLLECRTKCLNTCECTAYAAADVRNGGTGCIMWTNELTDLRVFVDDAYGQELYVRLAAADLGMLEITTSLHDHSNQRVNDLELSRGNDLELPLLDLHTIQSATDNFSNAKKLGEGGFGPVYKGNFGDGQEIAVKRLAKTSVQGLVEFKNEVTLIAKLQHRNLVRIVGCCIEAEERLLVYEYMPNKSLDLFIFGNSKDRVLDWQTRFKIIMGIARGLLYLHQDSRLRVIHRDLKASNILLDEGMNPKISDFGMARIFGDEAEGNTRKIVGTYGYMSPEYAMQGIFSQKSDVFSFGVIVLEIITGKKNRGVYLADTHTNLLDHVWSLWKEGRSLQMVNGSMGYSYTMNEVMRCINVGLLCVQNHPDDRPFMTSVVLMLSGDNASLPYPKEPGFSARRVLHQTESSSSKPDTSSANDMSASLFEGR
ncbi:hypothetical protein J5N97_011740 [Dioscorea zingiberensis]|uniref:Receptor-like serine/threonine-protein kinase n=1 Tax=Dioscorea zingiberensis TaxID=325984 RepID=A0A9D5D3M4_9LILI|nr:hypothetical protein J5N97_011740 [Dioscorea zingiberensis]